MTRITTSSLTRQGDLEIWRNRVIVEDDELEDPNLQITLSEALTIDDDFEIGEEVTDAVSLDASADAPS